MPHPPGSDSIAEQYPPSSFGAWLKRQRRLRDLTQEELAQRAGCARVTIRKFEADEMRPSKQLAELLAQALEIPAEERAAFVQFARGERQLDDASSSGQPAAAPGRSSASPSHEPRPHANPPPTGTVTFLFTDIEGSTRLWREQRQDMASALARHHTILREAIERNVGHVFQIVGDAFCAAFPTAPRAVAAATDAQRELQQTISLSSEHTSESGKAPGSSLRVRMGLHTGAAEYRDGGYLGPVTLSYTQRLTSAASGSQVLVSSATETLLREQLPPGISLRNLGPTWLKDFPQPETVYQLLAPDLRADFPPLNAQHVVPNNLPVQLTSFVGREQEIEEVKRLLTRTRLLTLTGSGGTGKTRLSLQAAADVLDSFPDGVWLVELAPLADPALVPQAVASVLRLRADPGQPIVAMLAEHLREKQLLLILDNCEHLIDACARLSDAIIRAAPHATILASSREALGITGETVYHVPSLGLPPSSAETRRMSTAPSAMLNSPHADLMQFDAVRLFVERASAARAGFVFSDSSAPAVVQICRRLDGIPLALELAAARLRALPVETIMERLDDRFRLLTGGSRTALPRQQTLRATID